MVSIARTQKAAIPSELEPYSPAIREATARLTLRITSGFENAEGTDLSFRVVAFSEYTLSSSLTISTHPSRLSHFASPEFGTRFCAASTISHTACAVRNFGFENNRKGKIACEKASSTISCESSGKKCKARKERCARKRAREAWEDFASTASDTAVIYAAGSETKTGRSTDGSEYKASRTAIEESSTRARNAERK